MVILLLVLNFIEYVVHFCISNQFLDYIWYTENQSLDFFAFKKLMSLDSRVRIYQGKFANNNH